MRSLELTHFLLDLPHSLSTWLFLQVTQRYLNFSPFTSTSSPPSSCLLLSLLPDDLLGVIYQLLDTRSAVALSATCKKLRNFSLRAEAGWALRETLLRRGRPTPLDSNPNPSVTVRFMLVTVCVCCERSLFVSFSS